jgi:hypothetical protein
LQGLVHATDHNGLWGVPFAGMLLWVPCFQIVAPRLWNEGINAVALGCENLAGIVCCW